MPAADQEAAERPPFHTWWLPGERPWAEFFRLSEDYRVRFPGYADFLVASNGTRVRAIPVPGTSEGALRLLFGNQVLPLAQSLQGELVFHASAVDCGPAAVAFAGVSGSGKSTLAAMFAGAGNPFLSDDALRLTRRPDGLWLAHPSEPSIRLWEDSEAALIPAGTPAAAAVEITRKPRLLSGTQLPFCPEPRPLRRLYFLGNGLSDDIIIRPAADAPGFIEWVRHSFRLELEDPASHTAHFDALAGLVRELPAFYLDYPRRYELLPEVRRTVLEHNGWTPQPGALS